MLIKGEEPQQEVKVYRVGEDRWQTLETLFDEDCGGRRYYSVLSRGGETLFTTGRERGSKLQDPPGKRKDILSFASPILTEDLAIMGKIFAGK